MKLSRSAVLAGMIALFLSLAPVAGIPAETGDEETVATQANPGAESITIDAGNKAGVPFPHRRHQAIESVTCETCHALFPQTSDSIAALKTEGTLGRKQVMKDLCISCHKETKKADRPSGPTSCKACHAG